MKKLIILEGPDGGGKTTLGEAIYAALSAQDPTTIHQNHGPYKGEAQIWKHYFDSMLPAYSDRCDVILDRCWLAEPVYGKVYRDGLNRLELWQRRILEHVASECRTTVVYCLPGVEQCVRTFMRRKEVEMLDNERQLRDVYELYADQASGGDPGFSPIRFARTLVYDYTIHSKEEVLRAIQ